MQAIANLLLVQPEYRPLNNLFKDRPHPTSSRLHYALAAVEDDILRDIRSALAENPDAGTVVCYMFDGAVIGISFTIEKM